MPRDLTDLMEAATSSAPPETHLAGDITRLAQHRQRRRTTWVAAGAAAALAVVAGVTVGLTLEHPSRPEPAAPIRTDQRVSARDAVAASSVAGYRELHYAVPATAGGVSDGPAVTYTDLDASGRLVVTHGTGGDLSFPTSVQVLDGPDATGSSVTPPASPGTSGGRPIVWVPSFADLQRLLWSPFATVAQQAGTGVHVTTLEGSQDQFVPTRSAVNAAHHGLHQVWLGGDRLWFTLEQRPSLSSRAPYELLSAPLSDPSQLTTVAPRVAAADVRDGMVGWLTGDGHLVTQSVQGGSQHSVAIPLDHGCAETPAGAMDQEGSFAVGGGLVALTERCTSGDQPLDEPLVLDSAGTRVVHLVDVSGFALSVGSDALVFSGFATGEQEGSAYRYDLRTAQLAELGSGMHAFTVPSVSAGRYVLWTDSEGTHVGEFPG